MKRITKIVVIFFILLAIFLIVDLLTTSMNGKRIIELIPCLSKNC